MDRPEGLQKIPVDELAAETYGLGFVVLFTLATLRTYKKEVAALRKEVIAFKKTSRWYHYDSTSGRNWSISSTILHRFVDWLEFKEPLEVLIERANQEREIRQRQSEEDKKEQIKQYHLEARAKRIPCPLLFLA